MNDRRRFLRLFGGLACAPLFAGCGAPGRPLSVASHVWPGYELMFLARREGWLPTEGLAFLDTASSSESQRALLEGRADAAALTLDEVLRVRAQGFPLVVVLVFNESAGADALLVQPEIASLAELAGKRIGVEPSGVGALMLHQALEAAGLPETAVTPVPLASDAHLAAWREGRVDAVVSYDPVARQLEEAGAVRLFDSRRMPDAIFDVLAVRPEAARAHSEALHGLVAGHFRALLHLRANPQDAAYRMAGRLGVEGHEVPSLCSGLEIPDLAANRAYLAADGEVSVAARRLSSVMLRAGMLPGADDLSGLVSPDYLPHEG